MFNETGKPGKPVIKKCQICTGIRMTSVGGAEDDPLKNFTISTSLYQNKQTFVMLKKSSLTPFYF